MAALVGCRRREAPVSRPSKKSNAGWMGGDRAEAR